MGLRTITAIGAGVFAAGLAAGLIAQRRGIPPNQVRPWLTRELLRALLHAMDRVAPPRSA